LEAITARRICLIGSECTGKTRLAEDLARHFGTVWLPEYARDYAVSVARPLTYMDVIPIAEGQIALEERAARRSRSVVEALILDTDLISTVVYSRHHYGHCPEWIEAEARKRRADLYLLLDIDVPWIADPVRDCGDRREELHQEFRQALEEFGAKFVVVYGTWEQRLIRAVQATESAIRGPRTADRD
jgi:NadR type nicotinamide-nucleotide adenylyltransferase